MSKISPPTPERKFKPSVQICAPELLQMNLSGKVIIVTGGYTGIGLHVVKQLLCQKATIVIAGRDEAKGAATVAQLTKGQASETGVEFMRCVAM